MPTLVSASGIVEDWLFRTLSGDGTLSGLLGGRIYSTVAPQGATYPLLVFASLGLVDTNQLGPFRTLSQALYDLSAYDAAPTVAGLDAIMARVDALLQGGHATTPGGYVLGCRRERQRFTGDPDAGISYRRLASVYRLFVQEGH